MYPNNSNFAVKAYKGATQQPFSYLMLDFRPKQNDHLRLRTNIFPSETHYVYVPKWATALNAICLRLSVYEGWVKNTDATTFGNVTDNLSIA